MRYSLWSRNRLLGETDLESFSDTPGCRVGGLVPTLLGEQLLPVVTSVNKILLEAGRDTRRARQAGAGEEAEVEMFETAFADMKEAATHVEALELELRGPDGRVIPTESIDITDVGFLVDFGREIAEQEPDLLGAPGQADGATHHETTLFQEDREAGEPDGFWADYDAQEALPEERPFVRYQILVQLLAGNVVP